MPRLAQERSTFSANTPPQRRRLNFQDGTARCPEHSMDIAMGILGNVLVIRVAKLYPILSRLPGKFVTDNAQSPTRGFRSASNSLRTSLSKFGVHSLVSQQGAQWLFRRWNHWAFPYSRARQSWDTTSHVADF